MLNSWKDVDPKAAEACLMGIRRRLHELDLALREQQELLKQQPENFAYQVGCMSLLKMQENLKSEQIALSQHRMVEKVTLALKGDEFEQHTAPIAQLGAVLQRLQGVFSSIGQALKTGPTSKGRIPLEIINLTELRIASVYPSSFGMSLVTPARYDLLGESLSASSLTTLFNLLSSFENEDALMRHSGELGIRTFSHLKKMFAILEESKAGLQVVWSDYTGTQYNWDADSRRICRILEKLKNIREEHSVQMEATGRLVGASILRNRFELLQSNGNLIEGKASAGVAESLKRAFGKVCTATLIETTIVDSTTLETRSYFSLVEIHEESENDLSSEA